MSSQGRSWANLVGTDGTKAVEVIKKESGLTNVQVVGEGKPVTMDYRTDRIRVFVDKQGKVTQAPTVG